MAIIQRSLLVYDPDQGLLDDLKRDPRTERFPVLTATSAAEASELLDDSRNFVTAVFFNPAAPTREWVVFVQSVRQKYPAMPVYMVLEQGGRAKLGDVDIRKLGIREAMEKPISYSALLDLVRPAILSFDAEAALAKAKESAEIEAAQGGPTDQDFVPIRAQDFLSGTKSYFDVYVRINDDRYLKLLQAGDTFDPSRVEAYLCKGVINFFIRREVQEAYLSYTAHLATALVKHKVAPPALKAAQTMNQGEQVMSFLKNQGVSESNLVYASSFVANMRDFTAQMKLERNPVFKGFLENVAAYDHGVATSLIAGMLARELDITHSRAVELVGMGALLHDVALNEPLFGKDPSKLSPAQRTEYENHPANGAEVLSRVKGLDTAVVQAVRQHHMRSEGRGFPARPPSQRVSMIAEIVGISSEFAKLIANDGSKDRMNAMFEMEEKILPQFSRAVAEGFRRVFYEKVEAA